MDEEKDLSMPKESRPSRGVVAARTGLWTSQGIDLSMGKLLNVVVSREYRGADWYLPQDGTRCNCWVGSRVESRAESGCLDAYMH